MGRIISFGYGVISYLIFLGSFLYAIGFIGDFGVPKTINTGPEAPFATALVINLLLLGLFAVQHSGMARQGFKRRWTNIIPEQIERSTYVLLSSLLLILIFWQWRPIPEVIWSVEMNTTGYYLVTGLYWLGWGIVLLTTFMIDHFSLFGLKQVYCHLKGKEFRHPDFQKPGLYKYMRHPLMFGFLVVFWATPQMTVGHLVFSIAVTGYIFVGIALEERDLSEYHGENYERYKEEVPMIIPVPSGSDSGSGDDDLTGRTENRKSI